MVIDEQVLESSAAVRAASRRPRRRRVVVIGAATMAIAGAAAFAVVIGSGASDSRDVPTTTVDPAADDAVDEQALAEPNQVATPRSRDDVIRNLVERGLVPAATLEDGIQISTP